MFPSLPPPAELTGDEERILAGLAAEAVEACVSGRPEPEWGGSVAAGPPAGGLRRCVGVFVTVFAPDDLRGCLGMAEGHEPLGTAVPRLAWAAASRDFRFEPVSPDELPKLRIEITVLGPLTRLPADPAILSRDLDPNVCGVYIVAPGRTGLLLPQVARRLGWDARELLEQVSRKAGLDRSAWMQPGSRLYGFTARSFDAVKPGELPRAPGPGGRGP